MRRLNDGATARAQVVDEVSFRAALGEHQQLRHAALSAGRERLLLRWRELRWQLQHLFGNHYSCAIIIIIIINSSERSSQKIR